MFKTQINPTTGKMETIGGPSSPLPVIPLAELRKATRDVIEGNTQFHTDPEWGEKKEEENEQPIWEQSPLFRFAPPFPMCLKGLSTGLRVEEGRLIDELTEG